MSETESIATIRGRAGAHKSWGNTPNRSARTRPARAASPAHLDWHLERQGPEFADASLTQRMEAAESARRAYFHDLAVRSAEARRARKVA